MAPLLFCPINVNLYSMKRPLLVFALALLWFSFLIPWTSFADPDAVYHAKISLLLWQTGPVASFPWLDLTTLTQAFADHHFLFHVVEAPFVAFLGLHTGARVTAVILASAFLTGAYLSLRWMKVSYAWFWTIVLALTQPLIVRLLLAKASPLALLLFVLGLAAAWKRKPLMVFLVSFIFALSHGGWALLVGSVWLLALGDFIFYYSIPICHPREGGDPAPIGTRMDSCLRRNDKLFKESILVFLGALAGTFVHPNFPENISFLWTQVVKIGLGTPFQKVILGSEWLPPTVSAMVSSFAPWLIALLLGLCGLAFTARQTFDRDSARGAIAFALPVAVLLALTFKSRRSAEYLAPALFLWIPMIWNMVDGRKLRFLIQNSLPRTLPVICCLLLVALVAHSVESAWRGLHTARYPDYVFASAMLPVTERAKPADRVFHSDWDEFPILFSLDDRLRYVAGLDPTFLYEASSTLSDAYRDLTWGRTSSTQEQAWDLISGKLQARFVFIDKRDHAAFLELIKSDARYLPLAETADAATFEVVD